jgi:hypothetical protein
MAIEIAHTETIHGVKIDYLSWGDRKITTISGNKEEQVSIKDTMHKYGETIAPHAAKHGFPHVQIGSIGDFSYFHITSGKFIPLSTMYVARLLKR